jgi:NTP pyrophosphatase (non-canonical NTP hydrolase)
MNDAVTTVAQLKQAVASFVDQRDWGQFHSPKNLAMSVAIEAAELMEHFQWLDVAESRQVQTRASDKAAVGEEIADVLAYLLALANTMEIDLAQTFAGKMVKNQAKYPATEFQGRWHRSAPTDGPVSTDGPTPAGPQGATEAPATFAAAPPSHLNSK